MHVSVIPLRISFEIAQVTDMTADWAENKIWCTAVLFPTGTKANKDLGI